jgi:hypothetical protein
MVGETGQARQQEASHALEGGLYGGERELSAVSQLVCRLSRMLAVPCSMLTVIRLLTPSVLPAHPVSTGRDVESRGRDCLRGHRATLQRRPDQRQPVCGNTQFARPGEGCPLDVDGTSRSSRLFVILIGPAVSHSDSNQRNRRGHDGLCLARDAAGGRHVGRRPEPGSARLRYLPRTRGRRLREPLPRPDGVAAGRAGGLRQPVRRAARMRIENAKKPVPERAPGTLACTLTTPPTADALSAAGALTRIAYWPPAALTAEPTRRTGTVSPPCATRSKNVEPRLPLPLGSC